MTKIVIYKEFGVFKTTTEENYKSKIQDVFKINTWTGFESANSIIEYCIKYCNAIKEDFIVIK